MARTRNQAPGRQNRSRAAISYAEASDSEIELIVISSDEEGVSNEQGFTSNQAQITSRITRSTRARPSPETEVNTGASDEEDDRGNGACRPMTRRTTRLSQRSRIPAPKRIHRRSSPSDSSESDHGYKAAPKRRKIATTSKTRASSPRRRAIPFKSSSPSKTAVVITGSGVIPNWQHDLEYDIWVRIFQFASYPLCDENTFQALPSLHWLLNVALMCRDFAEPAATVLYANPPLVPMTKAHRLMRLLKDDPSKHMFKYRQKIECLYIEVSQVAAYSLSGSGHLDLFELIKHLPRLRRLEFYHVKDMSPYRVLEEHIKWNYPEEIFQALHFVDPAADGERGDKVHICALQSWRWSSRLAGKKYPVAQLATLHLKPCFEHLRKLAFVNYQVPELKEDEEDPDHELALAEAVKALKRLEHLIFESCTVVNQKLLSMLPTDLQQLELINCIDVESESFGEFLLSHGRHLRVLVLNHNKALDLKFLPVLGEACPRLLVLRMNLTFYNIHATYRDSDPLFKELLLPDQIPVWPRTLQVIELDKLRNWSQQAAQTFFDSLLDSAAELPDLRKLSIQAIINIAWRDRAAFRDKWSDSLARVFKRVSAPPLPVFTLTLPKLKLDGPKGKDKVEVFIEEAPLGKSSDIANNQSSTASTEITLPRRSRETRPASPDRRNMRSTTRASTAGKYAESPSSSDNEEAVSTASSDIEILELRKPRSAPTKLSARAQARKTHFDRELEILRQTAGFDSPVESPPAAIFSSDSSGDDAGPAHVSLKKENKGKQLIQGMCDIVVVRIDNLRPTETQVTEADFLDEEPSGDEDYFD